jgi:uncharacterized protein (DUF2164 family)
MPLDQKAIISQIDAILDRWRGLKGRSKYDDFSDLREEEVSEVVTLLFAAIERLAPPGSSYVKNAKDYERLRSNIGVALAPLAGILKALRADYDAGNLQSIVELVHADIFADFLEMADYLLQQGYKDAAAVIVGSVLEEHLRKLAQKSGIAVVQSSGAPKKADMINAELAAAVVYSKLDQKSLTAWLDLRNKAAHGKYTEYTTEQVALTLQGVRDFAARLSA